MKNFSLFDKEVDFLINDVFNRSATVDQESVLGNVSELIQGYEKEDINTFLKLYLPVNGEKFSLAEMSQGLDRVNRYLTALEESSNEIKRLQTGVYNQIAYEREEIRDLIELANRKLDALRLYNKIGITTFTFLGNAANEWLSSAENGLSRLTVSQNSNGAVLPILSEFQPPVASIGIGALSNGTPGDPDNLDRVSQRDSLASVTDMNVATYFEYTRRGEDGVLLELSFELEDVSILNAVTVDLVEYPFTHQAVLKRAQYQLANGQWGEWVQEPEELSGERTVYLNPVSTKNVKLCIESLGADAVRTGNNLFSRRSILGIKDIKLHSIKYASEGQIVSKIREARTPKISLSQVNFKPTVESLFSYNLFARGGEGTWEQLDALSTDTNDFVDASSIQLKLNVSLNPSAFGSADSAIIPSRSLSNYQRFTGSSSNPNRLYIDELFIPETAGAVEAYGFNIGKSYFALRSLATENPEAGTMFPLPGLLLEEAENLDVTINGRKAVKDSNPSSPDTYNIAEIDNELFVRIGANAPNSEVKVKTAPETLAFSFRAGRAIAELNHAMVPIKDSIRVEYLAGPASQNTQPVPPGESLIMLNGKYVSDLSIQELSGGMLQDAGYTEVAASNVAPRSGFTGSNQYYVNTESGTLYLSEDSIKKLFVSYTSKSVKETSKYSVYTDTKNIPRAVVVDIPGLATHGVEEVLGQARSAKAVFGAGSSPAHFPNEASNYNASSNVAFLSDAPVLPGSFEISESAFTTVPVEVPFIDGSSEFSSGSYGQATLGAGVESSGQTTWTISDFAFINSELGVFPTDKSVFVAQVGSSGDVTSSGEWAYNSTTGELVVYGTGLGAELALGYFFLDFSDSSPMYSVDYAKGRVFFSEAATGAPTVKYKVAAYQISYEPAKPLTAKVDNNYLLVPGGQVKAGSKITAFYDTLLIESDIKDLISYYSPVFKSANVEVV